MPRIWLAGTTTGINITSGTGLPLVSTDFAGRPPPSHRARFGSQQRQRHLPESCKCCTRLQPRPQLGLHWNGMEKNGMAMCVYDSRLMFCYDIRWRRDINSRRYCPAVGDGGSGKCRVLVRGASTGTKWINREVPGVHRDTKMGFRIVDKPILDPPSLGRTGFGAKYMLACGPSCAPQAILHVLMCLHPTLWDSYPASTGLRPLSDTSLDKADDTARPLGGVRDAGDVGHALSQFH